MATLPHRPRRLLTQTAARRVARLYTLVAHVLPGVFLALALMLIGANVPQSLAAGGSAPPSPPLDTRAVNPAAGVGASGALGGTTAPQATTLNVGGKTHTVWVTTDPSSGKTTVSATPPTTATKTTPKVDEIPNKAKPDTTPQYSASLPTWMLPAAIIAAILLAILLKARRPINHVSGLR